MTVVITGISSLVLGHQKEVTTVEGESWRLNDELFLVGLLANICENKQRRTAFKASCFQAFRINEKGAASFLQQWWRKVLARKVAAKAAAEAAAKVAAKASTKSMAKAASKPPAAPVKLAACILPSKASPSKEKEKDVVSTPSTTTPSPKTTIPSTSLVAAGASVVQSNSACLALALPGVEIESPVRNRPHGIMTDGPASSTGSVTSSPSAAMCATPRSGKVATARGENPYKRRFNPKEAARLRREKEEAERKVREAKEREIQQAREEEARHLADDDRPSCGEELASDMPAGVTQCQPPSEDDEQRAKDYGRRSGGLSMSTPQDRGPEHKPGMRALIVAQQQENLPPQSPPEDAEEYGARKAGLSMASPIGPPQTRGPPSQRQGDATPRQARAEHESRRPPSQHKGTADSTSHRARATEQGSLDHSHQQPPVYNNNADALENMDFAQIQKLISLGISQNETDAGFDDGGFDFGNSSSTFEDSSAPPPMPPMPKAPSEERSVRAQSPRRSLTPRRTEDVHETSQRTMTPRHAAELRQNQPEYEEAFSSRSGPMQESYGLSQAQWNTGDADLDAAWEQRIAGGGSTPRRGGGAGGGATPRSGGRMAEIRAAAERRAFGAGGGRSATPSRPPRPAMEEQYHSEFQDPHATEMRALTEGTSEREARMSEIREMTTRRTQRTPRGGDGSYQPRHCYGGRGVGGNLASKIGLKFGTHEALEQQLAISN